MSRQRLNLQVMRRPPELLKGSGLAAEAEGPRGDGQARLQSRLCWPGVVCPCGATGNQVVVAVWLQVWTPYPSSVALTPSVVCPAGFVPTRTLPRAALSVFLLRVCLPQVDSRWGREVTGPEAPCAARASAGHLLTLIYHSPTAPPRGGVIASSAHLRKQIQSRPVTDWNPRWSWSKVCIVSTTSLCPDLVQDNVLYTKTQDTHTYTYTHTHTCYFFQSISCTP